MTAPTPNAALAYKVLDTARAHGDHFDMGDWGDSPDCHPVDLADLTGKCGTTACLAGWTVAMAGFKVDSTAAAFDADGARVGDAVEMAGDMLGITQDQAHWLFYSGDDVARVVAEIFGPRPEVAAGASFRLPPPKRWLQFSEGGYRLVGHVSEVPS